MRISNVKIILQETILNSAPCLLAFSTSGKYQSVIFLFHKLLKNKEDELPLAYNLARAGYFVIAVDMQRHGQRNNSFDKIQKYEFNNIITHIYTTANEIEQILNNTDFMEQYGLEGIPVGVVGASIGASVALCCGIYVKKVSFMACLIGTLDLDYIISGKKLDSFRFYAASNPVLNYKKVETQLHLLDFKSYCSNGYVKPLLFLDGKMDTTVPAELRRAFYQELQQIYTKFGGETSLLCKCYTKTGHEVTYQMQRDLENWLADIIRKKAKDNNKDNHGGNE